MTVAAIAGRSAARSHLGHVRRINEDRIFDCPAHGVWAVADGMGGHRGGDVAAQAVVQALRTMTESDVPPRPDAVMEALHDANAAIVACNTQDGAQAGATVVTLSRHGPTVQVAWAGDSRCYRLRDGRVELLTRDHSVVQQMIDAGLLTPDAAARHPHANVVTRALGVATTCQIDHLTVALAAGDRFLLCSDGLSRTLAADDVTDGALDELADRLLGEALVRDGADNISLLLVEFR